MRIHSELPLHHSQTRGLCLLLSGHSFVDSYRKVFTVNIFGGPMTYFLIFILLFATHLSLPAFAAELGLSVIPKNMSDVKAEDLVEAVSEAKAINATLNINVFGWHDIEPNNGKIDFDSHLGGLIYGSQQGMRIYFGIAPINTNHKNVPEDLQNAKWTDPKFVERFDKLMQAASVRLPRDVPYIVIGNEVDVYFEKNPDEIDDYLQFYKAAAAVARRYFPNAKIGITVTYEGLQKNHSDLLARFIKVSDAAFFTFYPNVDLNLRPVSDTGALLDKIITAASGKPVVLQEVGYYSSTKLGSSPQRQADFFHTLLVEVQKRPQISVLAIFSLHDIDIKMCKLLTGYYGFSGASTDLIDRFQEAICTLGIRNSNGTPKAAWFTIFQAMDRKNITKKYGGG